MVDHGLPCTWDLPGTPILITSREKAIPFANFSVKRTCQVIHASRFRDARMSGDWRDALEQVLVMQHQSGIVDHQIRFKAER